MKNKKWSRKHDRCVVCGTMAEKHRANGLCQTCYSRKYRKENKESIQEHNNLPAVVEHRKKRQRKYYINNKESMLAYSKERYTSEQSYAYSLRRKYNISVEDYDNLYNSQSGRCAICGKHQAELNKRLSVDHNHDTGDIRGLLCLSCNVAIGLFGDNIQIVEEVLAYLNRFEK